MLQDWHQFKPKFGDYKLSTLFETPTKQKTTANIYKSIARLLIVKILRPIGITDISELTTWQLLDEFVTKLGNMRLTFWESIFIRRLHKFAQLAHVIEAKEDKMGYE